MSRRFSLSAWVLAFSVLALSMMAAPARPEARVAAAAAENGVETTNCFDTRNVESCITVLRGGRINPHVIAVPQAVSEQERALYEQRDRRWMQRCRPEIQQDRYGMPRYVYAAPGCEYGVLD